MNQSLLPLETKQAKPAFKRSGFLPLFGLSALIVEDSHLAYTIERILCIKSGLRVRYANCYRSAEQHLKVYRPSIAIVDLSLPDGDGCTLIQHLSTMNPTPFVILAASGDSSGADMALAAGAHAFWDKSNPSLGMFQSLILQHLPDDMRPKRVRPLDSDIIQADDNAYQQDLHKAIDLLQTQNNKPDSLSYVRVFLLNLARFSNDTTLTMLVEKITDAKQPTETMREIHSYLSGLFKPMSALS